MMILSLLTKKKFIFSKQSEGGRERERPREIFIPKLFEKNSVTSLIFPQTVKNKRKKSQNNKS